MELFLVWARSADRGIESMLTDRIEQGVRLQQGAALLRPQTERIARHGGVFLRPENNKLEAFVRAEMVAETQSSPGIYSRCRCGEAGKELSRGAKAFFAKRISAGESLPIE